MNELEGIATKLLENTNQGSARVDALTNEVFLIKQQQSDIHSDVVKLTSDQANFLKLWESEKGHFDGKIDNLEKTFSEKIEKLEVGQKGIIKTLWSAAVALILTMAAALGFYYALDISRDDARHQEVIEMLKR